MVVVARVVREWPTVWTCLEAFKSPAGPVRNRSPFVQRTSGTGRPPPASPTPRGAGRAGSSGFRFRPRSIRRCCRRWHSGTRAAVSSLYLLGTNELTGSVRRAQRLSSRPRRLSPSGVTPNSLQTVRLQSAPRRTAKQRPARPTRA